MEGRIFQLNISPGGVPKLPLREAMVGELGLEGDGHSFPDIHGGPERALCLFSLERILELQAEGHPIFPGAAGENITILMKCCKRSIKQIELVIILFPSSPWSPVVRTINHGVR